ncbi:centrin-1 [Plakobranchus ocellatus]|uniref:Centrin-1 n=1 Tax=Plakobranchus ocellatus TaxID=259542 RepID=A0AAV4AIY3_9GAST|nr:centrin-1 [Plakobranchus ocellatus]
MTTLYTFQTSEYNCHFPFLAPKGPDTISKRLLTLLSEVISSIVFNDSFVSVTPWTHVFVQIILIHVYLFMSQVDPKKRESRDFSSSASELQESRGSTFLPVTIRTGLCRCANLSTKRGRRNHALMIMLVSIVPVIALLIQNSIDVYGHGSELSLHRTVKREILFR